MSDNKKYYYLKLKDSFFDTDSMIVLESMPDGYKYSNILLKLYLRSLKGDGKLMFNERIPFNSTILSQVTRHSVGDVEKAIKVFKELDLIEILDNGAIYMLDIQNFIGESSTEGDRKRLYRKKIEQEKQSLLGMGQMSGQMSDNRPPEIEIEKEKEIDKESRKDTIQYSEIINYLNKKTGKNFKNVESNKKFIRARWNEGYRMNDFKKVIDNKVQEWKGITFANGKLGDTYLKPSTLFASKFDEYLNSVPNNPKQKSVPNKSEVKFFEFEE